MAIFNIKTDVAVMYSNDNGATWTNIESDTYELTIERGIAIEQTVFARPNVGTLSVSLMKGSLGDFIGVPGYKTGSLIQVRVQATSTIFFGKITNIAMEYIVESKQLKVQIDAEDYMKVFLNTLLSTFSINGSTPTAATKNFKYIIADLNTQVQAIDSNLGLIQMGTAGGLTYFNATGYVDVIAGDILNMLLDAELGWCWADMQTGNCFYMTRNDIGALKATAWSSGADIISNVHSTSTSHHCMSGLELAYEQNSIANVAKVIDKTSGIEKTVTNSTSVTNYGRISGEFTIDMDINPSPYSRLTAWATRVSSSADPKYFKSVTIPGIRRDGTLDSLYTADVGQIRQIEFAASGYTTLQEKYLTSSIRHNITPDFWEIQFGLWRGM